MLDPIITAAVARLGRAELERDLRALAVPRHHRADPAGLAAAAARVEGELAGAGYRVTRQDVVHEGARAPNLVAERAGEASDRRVVIVCAHYDAVAGTPGADDNASAVAGMLAIARAAAAVRTRAALRFIGFSFEEQGLVGSSAYTAGLDRGERARIVGVLDLEMIGFTAAEQHFPPGVEAISEDPIPARGDFVGVIGLSTSRALLDAVQAARAYVPELPVARLAVPRPALAFVPDLLRSDHAPFWEAEIPAVMVTDTANFRNPNYHHASDTIATIDFDFATRVSRLVLAAALLLAEPIR